MADTKEAKVEGKIVGTGGPAYEEVVVHPLVLLSVVDHYRRVEEVRRAPWRHQQMSQERPESPPPLCGGATTYLFLIVRAARRAVPPRVFHWHACPLSAPSF